MCCLCAKTSGPSELISSGDDIFCIWPVLVVGFGKSVGNDLDRQVYRTVNLALLSLHRYLLL